MEDISRQIISDVAEVARMDAPLNGVFPAAIASTKDAGRVILGGGFAGVSANSANKVRA